MKKFKSWMEYLHYLGGAILFILTFLPLIPSNHWVFRVPEYLIIQIGLFSLGFVIFSFVMYRLINRVGYVILGLNIVALVFIATRLLPYSAFSEKLIEDSTESGYSLMLANVLQTNKDYEKINALIQEKEPSIFIGMETNQAWIDHLTLVGKDYKNKITIPWDNTYGLTLFTDIPIEYNQTHYLVKDTIPSLELHFNPINGLPFRMFVIHPEPPSPTEVGTSGPKDRELLTLKRKVIDSNYEGPLIIAGDFNDVPWSFTTMDFKQDLRVGDSRHGRGLFNTFMNQTGIGIPLDQAFFSEEFKVKEMEVLSDIGSDHLPLWIDFNLSDI